MTTLVLRVRFTSGDRTDLVVDDPEREDQALLEHVISTLGSDTGVLRCRHGDRLVVLYGRGVASVEVSPRGAVL